MNCYQAAVVAMEYYRQELSVKEFRDRYTLITDVEENDGSTQCGGVSKHMLVDDVCCSDKKEHHDFSGNSYESD